MGNFARKIIDAVQNLFLDKLVLRLCSMWWLAMMWESSRPDDDGLIFASSIFAALLVLFAIAWMIGAVANLRPQQRKGRLQRLETPPSNGFEAWLEPPEGGLRPPPWLRKLVIRLGRPRTFGDRTMMARLALFLPVFVGMTVLAYGSETLRAKIHPSLANGLTRDALLLGAMVAFALMLLRSWAVEQCDRLEGTPPRRPPPQSDLVRYGGLCLFMLMLALVFYLTLGLPLWIIAVLVLTLVVIAFIPTWRKWVCDLSSGKPDELEAKPADKPSVN